MKLVTRILSNAKVNILSWPFAPATAVAFAPLTCPEDVVVLSEQHWPCLMTLLNFQVRNAIQRMKEKKKALSFTVSVRQRCCSGFIKHELVSEDGFCFFFIFHNGGFLGNPVCVPSPKSTA